MTGIDSLPPGQRWGANGALLVFGIVAALGVGEVAIRVLAPEAQELFAPHPVLGMFHIPGARATWTREGTALVEINTDGLRDREISVAKPPGTTRVLVLGDSIVEALQVPLDATFVKTLERGLERQGHPEQRTEVINGGVSGFGTAQEYLFFTQYGLEYKPDLVVLTFTVGNDVRNNSERLESYRPTPFFSIENGRLVRSGRAFYYESVWKKTLREHSHLYLFLMRRKAVIAQTLGNWRAGDALPADLNVYSSTAGRAWDEVWEITERLLGEIARSSRSAGAALLVVAVPDPPQVYPWTLQRVLRGQAVPAEWDLDLPQKRLRGIAERTGVPFVDLLGCFRAVGRARPEPLFFDFNGHLTADGHRVVSTVLLHAIQTRQLLPRSTRAPATPEMASLPGVCEAA